MKLRDHVGSFLGGMTGVVLFAFLFSARQLWQLIAAGLLGAGAAALGFTSMRASDVDPVVARSRSLGLRILAVFLCVSALILALFALFSEEKWMIVGGGLLILPMLLATLLYLSREKTMKSRSARTKGGKKP